MTTQELPVVTTRPSRRIAVCPISRHPGFQAIMARLLSSNEFKLLPLRLGPHPGPRPGPGPHLVRGRPPEGNPLLQASVFVLDPASTNFETDDLIEHIRNRYPESRILLVMENLEDETVFPRLRLGVRGVVRYADAERDLARAVKTVISGEYWLQSKQLARFVDWIISTSSYRGAVTEPAPLSRRERQVLGSLLSGLTNKEIAATLNISERTVKFHVSHLLQKLGAQRRADLIARKFRIWPAIS